MQLRPRHLLFLLLPLFALQQAGAAAVTGEGAPSDLESLISWLLADGRELSALPFAEVVRATAGVEVLPVDLTRDVDRRMVKALGEAMEAVLAAIRSPEHPIHQVGRINEVSGHLEDLLLEELNRIEGFACTFPPTASGRIQRSGYPDLRLVDRASGRVFYIDPKLFAAGSEQSSFRTFYFEPKTETNKILEDASHLILGIAHGGRAEGQWVFLHWKAVDLHRFQVRLKAEFQASNRDLYRAASIIAQSAEAAEADPEPATASHLVTDP